MRIIETHQDEETNHFLKLRLIEAFRGLQHACTTAVIRDDDGDDGDIATPKTCDDSDY
jgi:hypothetical protein